MIVSVVSLKTIDPYHLYVYAVKSWNMYPLQQFSKNQIMWNTTYIYRIHWWCHKKYGKLTSNRCFNYGLF